MNFIKIRNRKKILKINRELLSEVFYYSILCSEVNIIIIES